MKIQTPSHIICNHPELSVVDFQQRQIHFPSPAYVLTCECGKNKLCRTCGWHELLPCSCSKGAYNLGLHNAPSGVRIPTIAPKMGD